MKMAYQFDDVLKEVGSFGKFQKLLVFFFLLPICFTLPFFLLNTIFLLTVPDHFCIAPGQDLFNYTIEEWKNLTVPRKDGSYQKCSYYDTSSLNASSYIEDIDYNKTIDCKENWHYDGRDFGTSVVVFYNWVCEEEANVPFGFSLMILGNSIGTLFLSPLADIIGRRIVFFITAAIQVVFGLLMTFPFTEQCFFTFLFLKSLAFPVAFQVSYVQVLEFVGPKHRGFVNTLVNLFWSLGMVCLSVVAYLCSNHWKTLSLTCSLLGGFLFLYIRVLKESPRWLISKGRFDEANEILLGIMKTNGKYTGDVSISQKITQIQQTKPESIKNMLGLFLKRKQVLRVILITLAWSAVLTLYYGCHFNLENMAGNIYWNNIALAAIEVPAYLVTGVLLDIIGRRWCGFGFLFLAGASYILVPSIPADSEWLILTLCVIAKFGVSAAFMTVYLHAPEIFPTSVRSCALGFPACISNLMNILGPYVVFLGHTSPALPFVILGGMSLIAAPLILFLPETLNQKLPQTLVEAEGFGGSQFFWSFNNGRNEKGNSSSAQDSELTEMYKYKSNEDI